MNSRFLPMGVALAPSLPGRALWRAAQGQTVVDASWALAAREDGTFDRWVLFGSTSIQYVTWTLRHRPRRARREHARRHRQARASTRSTPRSSSRCWSARPAAAGPASAAALGALIALALVPFAPAGVPVLVASLGALIGLTNRAQAEAQEARA